MNSKTGMEDRRSSPPQKRNVRRERRARVKLRARRRVRRMESGRARRASWRKRKVYVVPVSTCFIVGEMRRLV